MTTRYGGVSTEFRDGTYDCSGQATALAKSGPPLVLGKPVFWAGPGFYMAFGFTRRVAAVRVTMFGKVIEPRLRHLGGGSAGVYAFPIPPHSGHGFSSGDITSVVGLAANGSIVSRAGPSASIMASPGRPAGQFNAQAAGPE